ncbi:MAG: mechanosensitive ion channel domain-containing protein [Flavobacteriales bacterium]
MNLEPYQIRIAETAIALIAFFLIRHLTRSFIRANLVRAAFKTREEQEIRRLLNVLLVLVLAIVVSAIWGLDQSEILVFATSVFTVLGIALFAEMSILSNVTACLVLFFQHPVKIGDRLRVYDQDHWVEGELMDITYFFVFVRTENDGVVSIPNSTLLKDSFHIIEPGSAKR